MKEHNFTPMSTFGDAYYALEDKALKRNFREEICANYGWSRATFYNKIKCGSLPPKVAHDFMRLINLHMKKG